VLDVLDDVSAALNLDARRIGISGWSAGGYGSLRIVTHHPERFAMWGGMIGVVDFPNPKYPPADNHSVPEFFGPPEQWAAANPMNEIDRLRGKAVWFGTGDTAFDTAMNRTLDSVLTQKHIDHDFEIVPGKHEFSVIERLLPKLIGFFSEQVAQR
jgi:S-formylglutathione hydrolase FrmB